MSSDSSRRTTSPPVAVKHLFFFASTLATAALHAAAPGLPDFNSHALPLPSLSLRDIVKGAPAVTPRDSFRALPGGEIARTAPKKTIRATNMPIIAPDATVDHKLIVRAPDPAVDFKMLVKEPESENTK